MTKIHFHPQLDSTSEECRRLLAGGATPPFAVVADAQMAGRGRLGRVWRSEPGNLYYSHALIPAVPPAQAATFSFVAALAAHDALQSQLDRKLDLSFKWPNDILCGGKKIAGILLESEADCLIVGIGINLLHFPEETSYPATSVFAASRQTPDRDKLAASLSEYLSSYLAEWQKNGFEPFRQNWLAKAAFKRQKIALSDQKDREGRPLTGIFLDLRPDGALLLETEEGIKPFYSGIIA